MTRIREEEDQSFVPYVKTFQAKYTTLRSPYGISRPSVSVVCDRVTLLRPTQRVNILGNIFAASNSSETWTVCVKYA